MTAEYPGKLFGHFFENPGTVKPHYFLRGYTTDNSDGLVPVHFTGKTLEKTDLSVFEQNRIPVNHQDNKYFLIDYQSPCKVTFSENCPAPYRIKTMTLPTGFFPFGFTTSGELLLEGQRRLLVMDDSLKQLPSFP